MEKNNPKFNEEILALRDRIDEIDSQILSLLAQRQAQDEKVVTLKKRHHIPVYHPAREEDLISRLRIQSCKADLDPDFMEDLYRLILRQSRVKQIDQMEGKGVRPDTRVLVIGGDGQMGQFFVSLFRKSGYEVRILERKDWDKAGQLCEDIDLALVCVPIEKTCDIIEQIAPFLGPGTILARSDYICKEDLSFIKTKADGAIEAGMDFGNIRLSQVEEKAILSTLESAEGNKSEAARRLGITRKTLLKKLKQYGKV